MIGWRVSPGTTGIAVFDDLPKSERPTLLATLVKGLTDETNLARA